MGWMTGFIEQAGKRAYEQDMLELQQSAEQKKNLYDFYTKMIDHPSLREDRREELMGMAQQILQIPSGKKVPKQLYPESLLKKGGLFRTRAEDQEFGIQGAVEQAGRVQDRTLPGQTESAIIQSLATKHGTPGSSFKISGEEAEGQGYKQTTGGIPIDPQNAYQVQQTYDNSQALSRFGYDMFQPSPDRITGAPPASDRIVATSVDLPDGQGNVIRTPGLVDTSTNEFMPSTWGTDTPWGTRGSTMLVTPPASKTPNVSTSTTQTDPLSQVSSTTTNTARQFSPLLNPQGGVTPPAQGAPASAAPTIPPPPGADPTQVTDPGAIPPAATMQPVSNEGMVPPPAIVPGRAPTHRTASQGIAAGNAELAARPPTRQAETLAQFRKAAHIMADVPLEARQEATNQWAAVPAADRNPNPSQSDLDAIQSGRQTMYEMLNFYPSDYWEEEISKIRLPNQLMRSNPDARSNTQQLIRDLLNNPNLIGTDDLYKGTSGLMIKAAMASAGIPIPAKVSPQDADKASFALITLEAIRGLRQLALTNPKFLGVIQGRFNEAASRLGDMAWYDAVDKGTAQEILTRSQYFLVMEAKVLMGARPALAWAQKLEKVTAKQHMTLPQFVAALDAAEFHARQSLKESAKSQYGAKLYEMMSAPNAPYAPGAAQKGDLRTAKHPTRPGELEIQVLLESKSVPGMLVWCRGNLDMKTNKLINPQPVEVAWDPRAKTMQESGGKKSTRRTGTGDTRQRYTPPVPEPDQNTTGIGLPQAPAAPPPQPSRRR